MLKGGRFPGIRPSTAIQPQASWPSPDKYFDSIAPVSSIDSMGAPSSSMATEGWEHGCSIVLVRGSPAGGCFCRQARGCFEPVAGNTPEKYSCSNTPSHLTSAKIPRMFTQ
jgi:hypothetical protein